MTISKEGREFLDGLHIYLISTGKNEKEIKEFMEEAEVHLIEGEKRGKTVEDIFGTSPKAYADQVAKEMSYNIKNLLGLFGLFMLGAFSYIFLSDAVYGHLSYSWYSIIGYPVIIIGTLMFYVFAFRFGAFRPERTMKIAFVIFTFIQFGLFVATFLLNRLAGEPVLVIDPSWRWPILLVCLAIILILNITTRTFALILFPFFIFGPELLKQALDITSQWWSLTFTLIGYAGIFLTIWLSAKLDKGKKKE